LKVILNKKKNYLHQKYQPGETADIPDNIARRWIDRGIAYYFNSGIYYEANKINKLKLHDRVSIVILVKDALVYFKKCLESVITYTNNYELIVIDNGSKAETKKYLKEQQERYEFTLITNKENKGFSYGCNQGIKASTCDYICFLNSDTVATPHWLSKLMQGFTMPDAGIVGPSTCFSGGKQMLPWFKSKRMRMSQEQINSINPGTGIVETEIYGFCYTVARKVIDDIGVFDVARYPIGSAEEKDFSWRADKAGYKSYWVKDCYVHHFGNKSFEEMKVDPLSIRRKNDIAFIERKSDSNIYIENTVNTPEPAIPILMIVLDRLEYTKQAVEAVLKTDYPFKLFIFNNGSDKETTNYINKLEDSRIEIHNSSENLGLTIPMNMFFDKFKNSQYVAKVDNDTVVRRDWLGKLKKVMDKFPLFTVQSDHFLAMPFAIENNDEFYKHLLGAKFGDGMVYFFKNSGGTGQLIRRNVIDAPIPTLKGKGGLSGWCNMQVAKYKQYPSAFYTGTWIDRLDQTDTNKYKEISDYPDYDKMIKKMRPWGLGYAAMNISELTKLKNELKVWYGDKVGSLH